MKLSIIIPVYNEKLVIQKVIGKIKQVPIDKEIIIIEDGSIDGTRAILKRKAQEDHSLKVIYHPQNIGKGAAIKTGLKQVTGDLVIIQDGDLEYEPAEYPKLIRPILESKADIVYGSRFLGLSLSMSLFYRLGNKFLTRVTNILYRANLTDVETCYKVFKADIIKSLDLRCKRFEFEVEVTAKLIKSGYRIHEVPIAYHGRSWREGKKITWKDGLNSLFTLVKYYFWE